MNAGDFIAIGIVGVGAIVVLALPQTREWLMNLFKGGGGVFNPLTEEPQGGDVRTLGNCTCTTNGCCWTSIAADGQKARSCVKTTYDNGGCASARVSFCQENGPCTGQIGTAPAPGVYVDPKCAGVKCPTAHTHPIWVAAANRCSCAWDSGYGPGTGTGTFIPKAISTNCIQVSPTLYQWISTPCTNNSKVLPSYFGPGLAGKVYGLGEGTTCAQAKSSYLTRCGVPNVPPGGTQSNTCINLEFGSGTRTACCQSKFPCAAGTHSVSSTSTLHGGCSCASNSTPPPTSPYASRTTCVGLSANDRVVCCSVKRPCAKGSHSVAQNGSPYGCSCALNAVPPSTSCSGVSCAAHQHPIYVAAAKRCSCAWDSGYPKGTTTPGATRSGCAGLGSSANSCCQGKYGLCKAGQHWSLNSQGNCTCAANHAYIKSYAGQRSTGVFDYYDDPRISGRQRRAYASQRSTGTFDFYNNRRTNPPEHPETYQEGNRRNRLGRGLGDTMRANATQRSTGVFDYYDQTSEERRRKAFAAQRSTGQFNYYYNRNKGGAVDLVNNVQFSGIGGIGG